MPVRRSFILGTLGAIVSPSVFAKKPKSAHTANWVQDATMRIASGEIRPEYLPQPTRIQKIEGTPSESLHIHSINQGNTIAWLFSSAREFFRNQYLWTQYEQRKKILEKKYGWYEIIPYIIAPASVVDDRTQEADIEIIYMARRRNPAPKSADDWLMEWIWPLESRFDIDIIGVAPKAKTYGDILRSKTLWAGTNFQIYDTSTPWDDARWKQYVVLATRYPQYGEKEPNIQTPFSEWLAMPSVLQNGKQYFHDLQTEVTKDLVNASWALTLRDIEWYKIIQGLIITENMSIAPSWLSEWEELKFYERELIKVYALLWANGKDAFQRKSSAWAKGIVQFTEGAWNGRGEEWDKKVNKWVRTGIRHHYLLPGYSVNPDYLTMISDHKTSILAACAHVTSQYREYQRSATYSWFRDIDTLYKQVILAAGYNSNNTQRITDLSRVYQNGSGWIASIVERFYRILTNEYAEETRGYMRKFLFALKALWYHVPHISFMNVTRYTPPI